jgi:hypothetical protein
MHTGEPHPGPEGYVGHDVHLGARIGAAGHGGQVLLSDATRTAAGLADDALHDLGEHRLKDFERPIRIPWVERESAKTLDAVRVLLGPVVLERAWGAGGGSRPMMPSRSRSDPSAEADRRS